MYKVLVFADARSRIVAVNSDAHLVDTTGWTQIDEGDGDRYHHAQSNYLVLTNEDGFYRYKLVDGQAVERTPSEIQADIDALPPPPPSPTDVQSATIVAFRALTKSGAVTPAQALDHQALFPMWIDSIGKQASVGEYYRYDGLFRVKQAHIMSEEWPPGVATAAMFERIQPEGEIEDWQPGQSYAVGVHVMHNGFEWESMVANNIWEPGSAGVYENIWKKVIA